MEKVIINARAYLERGKFAQALLISDCIITKLGTNEEIMAAAPDADIIDAAGKTIIPGINDSHQHLQSIGEWLTHCSLASAHSIDDIIEIGRKFVNDHPERRAIRGVGWNQDYFIGEKRLLNRHDLDKITTEIPLVFNRVCGHILAVNTKALEVLGIDEKTPQFEGGVFEIGPDGKPNGVFNENAQHHAMAVLPPPTEGELESMFKVAMSYAVSVGITSVQSNDVNDNNYDTAFKLLHKLHDENKLLVRYHHQFSFLKIENLRHFIATELRTGRYTDDMLTLGALKLFKDGSLGARTGLMRKEYADDPGNYGVAALSDEQMDELCTLATENGIQCVTHVIGDAAVENTVDAYIKTMKNGKNELRHSLVHCQITDMAQLEKIAKYQIACLVQPIFLNYDLHIVEDRVGTKLASTSYAFGTMLKLGTPVAFGTDSPVESCNPFPCIYSAATRQDFSGKPVGGWCPSECVDVETAIDCYTTGSAYAEFTENRKGRIREGYLADLVILDRDIFTIPASDIKNVRVELTMIGGNVVYKR